MNYRATCWSTTNAHRELGHEFSAPSHAQAERQAHAWAESVSRRERTRFVLGELLHIIRSAVAEKSRRIYPKSTAHPQ